MRLAVPLPPHTFPEILQVVPVTASQVLGKTFLEPLLMHNWRLTPEQKNEKLEDDQKADPANSLAVRLMNPESAGTHSTIGVTSWLFRGIGGFDMEVPLGDDFWERILMMDPTLARKVITDENVVGIDLVDRPPPIFISEMAALSEQRCKLGSVKRNEETGFNPMAKPIALSIEPMEFDEIVQPKPEKERAMCGDTLTMTELTSDLLVFRGGDWLDAMQKWNVSKVGVVLNKFRIAVQRRFRS